MPHGTVSGYLDVSGGRLYYEVAGMGPHLVFIHGFTLDRRMWDDQWDYFRGGHTCIRYDMRGHGRSSDPAEPWSNADDLRMLLAHLDVESAHLCGLSAGGGVALDVAVTYPEAVNSLVLIDSACGGYRDWTPETRESFALYPRLAREEGISAALDMWLRSELFGSARRQSELWPRIERIVREHRGWTWLHDSEEIVPDPLPLYRLDDIQATTLVIDGEQDSADFRRIAGILASSIPGARRETITGASHLSSMEAPREVNNLIHGFLKVLPGRAANRL